MRIVTALRQSDLRSYDSIFAVLSKWAEFTGTEVYFTFLDHDGAIQELRWEKAVHVARVDQNFTFDNVVEGEVQPMERAHINLFDGLFLRLDPPIRDDERQALEASAGTIPTLNDPSGIRIVGSKEYLVNFPDLVPGACNVYTVEDVWKASEGRDVVLKTFQNFGGKGVLRLRGEELITGDGVRLRRSESSNEIDRRLREMLPALMMNFQENISIGDKRVVVAGGEILGAVLRVPQKGGWLANLAQGGGLHASAVTDADRILVDKVDRHVRDHGIYLYGVDIIYDESHNPVLSELNVTNVGGLIQIRDVSGVCLVIQKVASFLQQHFQSRKRNEKYS